MITTLAPAGFTQDTFDAFLASRDEPGWLMDLRQAAWKRFESLPLPSTREEGWMRTDIRLLRLDDYGLLGDAPHPAELPSRLLAASVELAGNVVAVNSRPFSEEYDADLQK
jgi:Fe-S cluster assembly protein SufD